MTGSNRGTVHTSPIGPRLEAQSARGNPHCPTCTYRIPTCEELSQVVCRPVRITEYSFRPPTYLDLESRRVNNPDLGQHRRRLHLRKGNSRHSWGSLSMHRSALQEHPATRSSGGSQRLRFGLVRKQASGFLSQQHPN
ncbi:hypothetical protein PIB30_019477 [Stylosanthes scabra]|uniref:Uncharacterized protein n=1 Tax=Stylosanthes scabra TaxID=79078 RepID=A0ABU6T816_9FABA|nr:hypothetical protein [Stylosanthes scabra]